MTDGLRARHVLDLSFDRSVGGATAAFLTGLAAGEIRGSKGADGRVTVPPLDGADLVPVGDAGVIRAWSWVAEPDPRHPLNDPFAFALIDLDGADTALLHVVEVSSERDLVAGLRVRADWRDQRAGSILDVRAFVPGGTAAAPAGGQAHDPIRVLDEHRILYTFEPGLVLSAFFRALADGRIEGGRCPACRQVHVPPHDRCPACGSGPMEAVEVSGRGTVVSFTVVHLPVVGLDVDVPFGWARILLDGADVSVPHVIGEAVLDRVRIGQRVEAVWAPAGQRPQSWEAIRYFRPVGS
jgi:uncharacterized OB-fold protein